MQKASSLGLDLVVNDKCVSNVVVCKCLGSIAAGSKLLEMVSA